MAVKSYSPKGGWCSICAKKAYDCGMTGQYRVVRLTNGGKVHVAWLSSTLTMCNRPLPGWAYGAVTR